MVMNPTMMRNMMMENKEKEEHKPMEEVKDKEHEKHEKTTVNLSAESLTDIAKMVSSMLESTSDSYSHKQLHDKYHELDKRLAVCEALLKK